MKFSAFIVLVLLFSCNSQILKSSSNNEFSDTNETKIIRCKELKIYTRYQTPENYNRSESSSSFGKWLNNISLKNSKIPVYTFDEKKKPNPNIYVGVLDLEQPKKNVQFNANAIISLRLEYFFQNEKYKDLDKMANIDTKPTAYTQYVNGDFSKTAFENYLIYYLENTTANTIKQLLKPIQFENIEIGDVFYQNGNIKNHAVMIMDIANDQNQNKLFILAQGYYPSQDIQILSNPNNDNISPWYEAKSGILLTPEWRFSSSDIMRFK